MKQFKILHVLSAEECIVDYIDIPLKEFQQEFNIFMEDYITTPLFPETDVKKEQKCINKIQNLLGKEHDCSWDIAFVDFLIGYVIENPDENDCWTSLVINEFELSEIKEKENV